MLGKTDAADYRGNCALREGSRSASRRAEPAARSPHSATTALGRYGEFCIATLGRWPAAERQLSRRQVNLHRQVGAGAWQLFCFNPNGGRVERGFNATESP